MGTLLTYATFLSFIELINIKLADTSFRKVMRYLWLELRQEPVQYPYLTTLSTLQLWSTKHLC